jgi:hypothetical protein
MTFPAIQAAYAAHGVATYPLTAGKKPAVRAYDRIGAPYSAQLAMKFADATAAGFVAGRRNRLTIVDIDSTDHRLVDEVERLLGPSPLRVATPSGGWHLYYRHAGEPRSIRPLPDVDLLGGGPVVCIGSQTPKGRYQIVRGTIDDLERLPRLAATAAPPAQPREPVPVGKRNNELFKYCQSIVGRCDDLDQLLDAARTWAADRLEVPLPDAEIVKTCTSAWQRRGGGKLFMQHIIEGPLFPRLIADPEVWTLCSYLMIEQGPAAEFMIADGLGQARGWPRRLVPTARKMLLDMGVVECVRPPKKGQPALYRWRPPQ